MRHSSEDYVLGQIDLRTLVLFGSKHDAPAPSTIQLLLEVQFDYRDLIYGL